jgi:hypothetical protein
MKNARKPPVWRPDLIALFVLIGGLIYGLLFAAAEGLTYRHGDRNPFFRILTAQPPNADLVILGASHAMPLGFAGPQDRIAGATGARILNLGVTGAGPFVQRLIAERYFNDHQARALLVVVDSFGFTSAQWNERRIGDADLLPRTPWDGPLLRQLWQARARGVPLATVANYASGFSKVNNRDRLTPDVWEGEAKFERSARPSALADRQRIEYLYPAVPDDAVLARYMQDIVAIIRLAKAHGAQVAVVRPPMPDRFRKLIPGEDEFAAQLVSALAAEDVNLHDFSAILPDPKVYFDTDHLNETGVARWLDDGLLDLLKATLAGAA